MTQEDEKGVEENEPPHWVETIFGRIPEQTMKIHDMEYISEHDAIKVKHGSNPIFIHNKNDDTSIRVDENTVTIKTSGASVCLWKQKDIMQIEVW